MQNPDPGVPLETNPFLAPGDDHLFYATAQLTQRLNLLHHLIRYSDQAIVVSGPEGSGKTNLVDRLLREGNSTWRAAVVEAEVEMDGNRLLARTLTGLDLHRAVVSESDGLDALREHLAAAHKSGALTVLVVDDAHYLSAANMDMLLKRVGTADYPGLRLLLVGDNDLADRVAGALGEALFHLVELPPLSREQSMQYITTRLDRSGTPARDLFSEDTVDTLWRQSGGYPGPLNRLAAEIIESAVRPAGNPLPHGAAPRDTVHKPDPQRPPAREGDKRLLWLIGGAAVVTVIVATALLKGGDESGPLLTRPLPTPGQAPPMAAVPAPTPSIPPAIPAPAPEPTAPPATPAVVDEAPPGPSPGIMEQPATEAPDPAPVPETSPPPSKPPDAAAPQPVATVKPPPPAPEPVVTPAPREALPPPPEKTAEVVQPWPLNLADDRYTLQLMGSHERPAVADLIKKYGLKKPVAVIQLVHQGRPWFVLLHGDYANRDAAIAAIRRLSAPLRALKPWARSVASIREASDTGT